MHQISLDPIVVDRAQQRRGQLRVFDCLDPRRAAHVVVDLQNGLMAPGAVAEIPAARDIVPNVNRISTALRQAGGLVVYIQNTFDAEAVRSWSTYFDHFCTPERRVRMIETFKPGSAGHALWPDLEVRPEDLLVRKRRFGAFAPGASGLHDILQARAVDTLIITGTASQICCESTARDAMMLNYKVFFVVNGNATFTDAEHNATLSAMALTFCDVIETASLIGMIGNNTVTSAATEAVMA